MVKLNLMKERLTGRRRHQEEWLTRVLRIDIELLRALHRMSLFQDLKLKRRKVDSRCSSDGESIGTSESTLSPDAQPQGGEGSPKEEKDRCTTPEELIVSNGGPSKSNGYGRFYSFMMKSDSDVAPPNGVNYGRKSPTVTTANVVVVKSEPGDDSRSTPSSSPGLEEHEKYRRILPAKRRGGTSLTDPKSPISIHLLTTNGSNSNPTKEEEGGQVLNGNRRNGHLNSNGHGSDSESVGSIKSEKVTPKLDQECNKEEKMDQDDDLIMRGGGGGSQSLSSSPRSILSSASLTGSPPRSNNNNNIQHLQNPPSSSPRRSPILNQQNSTLTITRASNNNNYSHRSSPASQCSSSSRGGSPPQPHHNYHIYSSVHPNMGSYQQHHQQQHPPLGFSPGSHLLNRLTENRSDTDRDTSKGGGGRDHMLSDNKPPISVVTSTSMSFNQDLQYRIQGVRPEVISGGAVTPTAVGMLNGSRGSSPPSSQQSAAQQQQPPHSNHGRQQQQPMDHLMRSNGHDNYVTGANGTRYSIMSNLGGSNGHIGGNNHNQYRKSPTHSATHRSPRSSPNSNSSGSNQHSPGSTGSGVTIIAGGSLGMPNSTTGNTGGTHHVNISRTPTVIMGEAGGVRTMIWSQPGQNLTNQLNTPIDISLGGGSSSPGSTGNVSMCSNASATYGTLKTNFNGVNSTLGNNNSNQNGEPPEKKPLSMEQLWADTGALNLTTGASNTTNGHGPISTHSNNGLTNQSDDDEQQPMICMICEDRATGLHYGIITCEGCKGFFKRTVQNRRVYTCVADGTCEITKAQRNRCQYCRFRKCIEQGMVLQAVREDRMPGGRNSGAVYNLYKVPVKYRKHKKGRAGANGKNEKNMNNNSTRNSNNSSPNSSIPILNTNSNSSNRHSHPIQGNNENNPSVNGSMLPPLSGSILMGALTAGPNETLNRRQMPIELAGNAINELVKVDNLYDIAALQNWDELVEARGELSEKLCQMGDSIVYRLVQWTKQLPFYSELPVEVHTRVLTHKWHELLVLTTSTWHALHSPPPPPGLTPEEETLDNLHVLQRCLQAMMGRSLTIEQLKQDVGQMVQKLTYLTRNFRRLGIRIEEYVTLKVIAMLQNTGTKTNEVTQIQERYIKVLRTFLEATVPSQPNRLTELLRCLPDVQGAASLLLESKMFYVPFLLNSALLR